MPSALIAIKVTDQQNLYLLSQNCLLLSLARRWRTGLARSSRISCSNTGKLGRCKPALAVACSSRPRSASFLVATVSTGR